MPPYCELHSRFYVPVWLPSGELSTHCPECAVARRSALLSEGGVSE